MGGLAAAGAGARLTRRRAAQSFTAHCFTAHARAAAGGTRLSFTLRDAQGRPVTGMTVAAVVCRPSRQAMDFRTSLAEQSPGVYAAVIHPPAPGLWEMQVAATGAKGDYQAAKRVELQHE